jgi:hypothetical protein
MFNGKMSQKRKSPWFYEEKKSIRLGEIAKAEIFKCFLKLN